MKKNKTKGFKKVDIKKDNDSNAMATGLCIGLCLGVAVGVSTDNIGLWLPIGLCLGISLGAAFSSSEKKK